MKNLLYNAVFWATLILLVPLGVLAFIISIPYILLDCGES